MMVPFILSGGSGTRLWPVSRTKYAKPVAKLFDKPLLEMAIDRLRDFGDVHIVSAKDARVLTDRLAAISPTPVHVTYEPFAKNTAAAVGLACRKMELMGKSDQVMGIFSADHLIENQNNFLGSLNLAASIAESGKVVTLGMAPDYPATGFGYIETGSELESRNGLSGYALSSFREKPDHATAEQFLASGKYFWNAGMFIFKAQIMIDHLKQHLPATWELLSGWSGEDSELETIYSRLESISIDYAVMEKLSSDQAACVPVSIGWSDVGSWDAVAEISNSDECFTADAENAFVQGLEGKQYAIVGLDDVIVVDTKDALLVTKRGHSQSIKKVVDQLKEKQKTLLEDHVFEDRPWGRYEILKDTDVFKSKVIEVLPNQKLSYQSHNRREEHWVVTQGQGEVTLNDQIVPVKKGTYIHIPLEAKHRIHNTGNEKLEFVEIQLGSYFGEDDIVRYQDDYNRK